MLNIQHATDKKKYPTCKSPTDQEAQPTQYHNEAEKTYPTPNQVQWFAHRFNQKKINQFYFPILFIAFLMINC